MEGQAPFSDNQQAERRNYWCPMFGTQYQGIRKGHGDTISLIILQRNTEAKTVLQKVCGLNLLKNALFNNVCFGDKRGLACCTSCGKVPFTVKFDQYSSI